MVGYLSSGKAGTKTSFLEINVVEDALKHAEETLSLIHIFFPSENKEMIFTTGQNNGDIDTMIQHQMPIAFGGYNCHAMTGKQCDAYQTTGPRNDRGILRQRVGSLYRAI